MISRLSLDICIDVPLGFIEAGKWLSESVPDVDRDSSDAALRFYSAG